MQKKSVLEITQGNHHHQEGLHKGLHLKRPFFQWIEDRIDIGVMNMILIMFKQIWCINHRRTNAVPDHKT